MIQYENKFHEIEKSYLSFSKFLFLNELVAPRIFYLFMPICEIFNELLYYQIVLYNIKYKKKKYIFSTFDRNKLSTIFYSSRDDIISISTPISSGA